MRSLLKASHRRWERSRTGLVDLRLVYIGHLTFAGHAPQSSAQELTVGPFEDACRGGFGTGSKMAILQWLFCLDEASSWCMTSKGQNGHCRPSEGQPLIRTVTNKRGPASAESASREKLRADTGSKSTEYNFAHFIQIERKQ